MQQIVVGVDGSEGSALALRWALGEARAWQCPIVALLAWSYLDQNHVDGKRFDPDYSADDARAALEHYVRSAIGEPEGVEVERRLACDLPARALLDACSADCLLVLGARGTGGFKGLLLGSVTQHCLHHAKGPIAVIRVATRVEAAGRTEGEARVERIFVGADGSESGRAALRWAARDAAAKGAILDVVYAWHPPYIGGPAMFDLPVDFTALEEAAKRALDEIVQEIDVPLPTPPRRRLMDGTPARAILQAAEGADLVVVGRRGHGGFAELLLGSVSLQVARHAPCPAVVVPAKPAKSSA